jgi:hypothetical protein
MVDSYITVTYSSEEPGMFETKIVKRDDGPNGTGKSKGSFRIIERKIKRFLLKFF